MKVIVVVFEAAVCGAVELYCVMLGDLSNIASILLCIYWIFVRHSKNYVSICVCKNYEGKLLCCFVQIRPTLCLLLLRNCSNTHDNIQEKTTWNLCVACVCRL